MADSVKADAITDAVVADVPTNGTKPEADNAAEAAADNATAVKDDEIKVADVEAVSEDAETKGATEDAQNTDNSKKPTNVKNGILKTTAKASNNYSENIKSDPKERSKPEDYVAARTQVEFYFSDSNLPDDNFLWDLTDGDNNVPVPLETILSFRLMKHYQPVSKVIEELKRSPFIEITGSEGNEKVNRKIPYDSTIPRDPREKASIYVKGFGDEEPRSQFDIEAFFAPYGPTNAVRLRRTPEKLFKGSVFVEFENETVKQAFLDLDPKPQWKGHPLLIMDKREYQSMKNEGCRDGTVKPGRSYQQGRGRGNFRGRGRGGGDKNGNGRSYQDRDHGEKGGDRDPNDWKKRRDHDQANGFKDRRGRGGRGGDKRGRGRGRRDDRGPRNDRNREREEKNGDNAAQEPSTSTSVQPASAPEQSTKRERENDEGGETQPTKKVDTKPEVATES